jgi:hypothetical protein
MNQFEEAAEKYVNENKTFGPVNYVKGEAFLAGCEYAAPKWISVEERLPEKDTPVLVTDGISVHLDEWCDIFECPVAFSSATIHVGEGWASSDSDKITHYQPLPSPPKD